MNTIQKIFSLLIGLSILTAIPHACKDDDESSAIEEAAREIQKIQKQVDKLAKALSDEDQASQSMEKAAQSLKEATESAAEVRQKLADAVKALLEAAKALKEDQEKSGTAGEIESAATELQETAEQRRQTKEETHKKLESVSKKLQQAKDMMIPPEKLVDIPDKFFYKFLTELLPQAVREGQKLNINSTKVRTLKEMGPNQDSIQSFEGIEYFTGLKKLYIIENKTKRLILAKKGLICLQLSNDKYNVLDISGCTDLNKFYLTENNEIKELNIPKLDSLKYAQISDNYGLKSLNISSVTALTELDCSDNNLTKLDLSNNPKLEKLDCSDNNLTKLDLSNNPKLKRLDCRNNNLTKLDLSNNPNFTKDKSSNVHTDDGVTVKWYGTKKTKTTTKPETKEGTTAKKGAKEKEATAAKTGTKKKPETKKKTTTKAGTTKKTEAAKKSKGVIKTIEELYVPIKVPDFKGTTKTFLMEAFEVINHFTKFDFATGKQVAEDSDEWDIAFAGQFVIINGGQKIQACTKAAKAALEETASGLSTTLSCTVDAAQPERTGNAAAFMFDYTSFDKVKDVKDVKWRQDTANEQAIEEKDITETMQSDPKGFFEFSLSPPAYTLIPFKNATAVFRTRDGKHYVKMQALNCYKGQPKPAKVPSMSPNFGYWTFKYYYNPVENDTNLDTSAP